MNRFILFKKVRGIYQLMHVIKIFSVSMFFFMTCLNPLYAMNDEDEEHILIVPKSKLQNYSENVRKEEREQSDNDQIIEVIDNNPSSFIPIVSSDNYFTEKRINNINDYLEKIYTIDKKLRKYSKHEMNDLVFTSLTIIKPPVNSINEELSLDSYNNNSLIFLQEFDEKFFKSRTSKGKWIFRTTVLPLNLYFGLLAPSAVDALNWYLAGNLLAFIPPGAVSYTISYLSDSIILPASVGLTLRVTEEVGDFILGKEKISVRNSSDDMENELSPHVRPLGCEINWKNSISHKHSRISPHPAYLAIAGLDALIYTVPFLLQFNDGFYVPTEWTTPYWQVRVAPLTGFYFLKTGVEDFDYLLNRSYARKSKENYENHLKQKILAHRLKTISHYINSPHSSELVNTLYDSIQKTLSSEPNREEYVSALSALFVKMAGFAFLSEDSEENNRLSSLTREIKRLPPETFARNFMEAFSIYTKGAAALGDLAVYAWGLHQVAIACGLDETEAEVLSFTLAVLRTTFSAFVQSEIQEQTFLSLRKFGSRRMDFWPLRWGVNAASAFSAGFLSFTFPAIIWHTFSNEASPTFSNVFIGCVAASTFLPQWTSYYHLLKTNFDTLVTKVVTTLPIKTTEQKKALLNFHLKKILELLPRLDDPTIISLYENFQEGHDELRNVVKEEIYHDVNEMQEDDVKQEFFKTEMDHNE